MNDALHLPADGEATLMNVDDGADAALFLLQQGDQSVHGQGCLRRLPAGPLHTLEARSRAFFAAQRGGPGLLVGAVPFDPSHDDALHQPVRLAPALAYVDTPAPGLDGAVQAEPPAVDYGDAVARAVMVLTDAAHPLDKVVLARSLRVRTRQPMAPHALLARLGKDPSVATYATPLPAMPGLAPAWLVGATPELLLRKRGVQVLSHPLAGSARRSTDAVQDERAAQALLGSRKDHAEHRHVVEAIVEGLAPWCTHVEAAPRPSLHATASMWHLGTRIHATLKEAGTPAATLLAALHPTPAVCGTPRDQALQHIGALEPLPRGFYAGAVGWLDAQGDGDWYVAIRCARLQGHELRLYAGAGIVADSLPEAEVAETAAKFSALLTALGVRETDLPAGPPVADGA